MFEVTVLFEGYSRVEEGGRVMRANCTCTLVRGEGVTAIVDTRTAWDGEEISEALKRMGLECDDVDVVVCTHGHSDHIGCNYLFKKVRKYHAHALEIALYTTWPYDIQAKQIVGQSISVRDCYEMHDFDGDGAYNLDGEKGRLRVIATPGHTLDSVSLIVDATKVSTSDRIVSTLAGPFFYIFENASSLPIKEGVVAIAGDTFEREEDLEDASLWRDVAGSEDPNKQAWDFFCWEDQ